MVNFSNLNMSDKVPAVFQKTTVFRYNPVIKEEQLCLLLSKIIS